jgi:CRP-like cAMP-binding protein
MWEHSVPQICRNAKVFRGLELCDIDLITKSAMTRRFSNRSLMTRQADDAKRLFLLIKGGARYFFETPDGKKLILKCIIPGQILGAATLATQPLTYLVSAEAVRDSVTLAWDGTTIRTLARRFPRLRENILLVAIDYLSWYVAAHAALISQSAQDRLAHLLLGYVPSIGHNVPGGIELTLTNEELANAANMTPYTTSRLISRWRRNGAIRKQRGKILLCTPRKLFL